LLAALVVVLVGTAGAAVGLVAQSSPASASAAAAAAASAPVRTFTYSLRTRGAVEADVFEFAATVAQVLNDPDGWSLGGAVGFEAVPDGGDFVIVLASPAAVDAAAGVCSDDFSCRVGDQVLINDLRWREGAAPYTATLAEYRSYVVSHEVGHWLGFGHASCPAPGEPSPIMAQQSKGLGGCTPTALPSLSERQLLADRLGVGVPVNGPPFGSLDVVAVGDGAVRVAGWAIDPDDGAPIDVHVYVDDRGVPGAADSPRPDVAAIYPAFGPQHGFDLSLPLAPGVHRVCAYGIDRSGGTNTTLGCVIVDYASPFGSLDVVSLGDGSVRVAGWAIDPHTAAPIDVHVYVGGAGHATRADVGRPDVGIAFPSAGASHGFDVAVPVDLSMIGDGVDVCAYGIDVGGGTNRLLGCHSVTSS
jgi:hypothetical protein